MTVRSPLIQTLTDLLGAEKIFSEDSVLDAYSKDMANFQRKPLLVAKVMSSDDISKILRFANDQGIPVSAWGAGSSLTGAVVTDGIMIDVSKLNRIFRVDAVNWYVHVEAGVVLDDLNQELSRHGFFFPPDPASSFICTVGGAISEGSGGLRCVKYGTMKDWVLALKVILPDGRVMKIGEPLAKNRAGYDLVHLFVGSEGTLGVITEAWLKIIPIPDAKVTRIYAVFDEWAAAGRAILAVRQNRFVPRMLEFLDRAGIEASNRYNEFDLEVGEAALLIDVEEFVAGEAERLSDLLLESGASKVNIVRNEEEAEKLLLARASIYLATAQLAPARMTEDVVVPIDRIVDYLSKVKELETMHGVKIIMQGHAGDGNIHPQILFDDRDPKSSAAAQKALDDLLQYAVEVGGSITGEHGVGLQKMAYLAKQLDAHGGQGVLELMRQIKGIFDPKNIMNPGKYVDRPAQNDLSRPRTLITAFEPAPTA